MLSAIAVQILLMGQTIAMNPAQETPVSAFAEPSLDGWKERSFAGNTDYRIVNADGINVLMGHTQGQASILYREQTIDLATTPVINWSWKVDRTYTGIDEQTKSGDDFPARLYVAAKTGFLPWETLAINYVWASDTETGASWTNPFTENAKMLAVQSGSDQVGQWTMQSRNVAEDFKQLFGQEIDELSGFAVMVDGDNTRQEATAWFGKIEFSAEANNDRP